VTYIYIDLHDGAKASRSWKVVAGYFYWGHTL